MTTTTFDPSQEGPTATEKEAEVNALAQGEKLAQAAAEDRAKKFEQVDANQEDIALIGGKFKSQDDLLNAYKQLEQKVQTSSVDAGKYSDKKKKKVRPTFGNVTTTTT